MKARKASGLGCTRRRRAPGGDTAGAFNRGAAFGREGEKGADEARAALEGGLPAPCVVPGRAAPEARV